MPKPALEESFRPAARHIALIPAAGVGARMGGEAPKQYRLIHGHPMLWHAIRALSGHPRIDAVYVVLSADDAHWDAHDWRDCGHARVLRCGADTRAGSVFNGLTALRGEVDDADWVLVHDAARPCLPRDALDSLIEALRDEPVGALLAAPVADTLKRAAPDALRVAATVPREGLWAAQTPQVFRYALLREALRRSGVQVTDEASAIEAMGLSPRLVASDSRNLKVTYPRDLEAAAWWLRDPG